MSERAPGFGRIAAMVIFAFSCFGLLLFLWLSFGGAIPLKPRGYQVHVAYPEATTLAEQAEVRMAGVPVGKVVGKQLDKETSRTLATLEIEREYAPLPIDTRTMLRQKTLLGETYVEITPGSRQAGELKEGGRLPDAQVEDTVEFDEFLEIFPEETRLAFRRWQENSAEVIEGRDRDLNAALGNLGPFAEDASDLLQVLDRRRGALKSLVRETGTVFGALTEDEEALRAFTADTARWFRATASEKERLAEAIQIFPTFLDESKATLQRLETFAVETEPLLEELRPVARDLQPTLRDLRRMAPSLRALFGDLPELIAASETGLPALADVLRALEPTFGETGPFLAQVNPLLRWLEMSNMKVSDFISAGPAALAGRRSTKNPNGQGHVLPQLITTGSQSLLYPSRTPDNRGNAYLRPDALEYPEKWRDGYYVFPVWDCVNAGGEKKADDTPGCYVQEPIPFQGKNLRFPHIEEDMPQP